MLRRATQVGAVVLAGATVLASGCSALRPRAVSVEERIARFPAGPAPVQAAVEIRWNDRMVPFIFAQKDEDAAVALGLVHAHLRLGQMEVFRRVSQGRLSELAGPLATDLDHAIRALGLGSAVREAEAQLPAETRRWLESYVAGINHFLSTVSVRPPEWGLLGLRDEPWAVADVLTIGRLAGADVNWFTLLAALGEADHPQADVHWRLTLENGGGLPATRGAERVAVLQRWFAATGRWGSNSVAIAAHRSATGAALIANDPHLGLSLPNFWVLAGIQSPSFHVVGLTIAGLPVFGLGRTPHLAWGGTNMRSASSDLYDVAGRPAEEFTAEKLAIRRRGWWATERTVRVGPWGRVVTDAPLVPNPAGRTVALRWMGQRSSDEVSAFLAGARARDVQSFADAFASYAVSGQNLVVADSAGRVAKVFAVAVPARREGWLDSGPIRPVPDGPEADDWSTIVPASAQPHVFDPADGFIASANNRPDRPTPAPLGFYFTPPERVERLRALVGPAGKVSLEDLRRLQRDVRSEPAAALARALVAEIDALGLAAGHAATVALLRGWTGDYAEDSAVPVRFELLLYHLVPRVYGAPRIEDLPAVRRQWATVARTLADDVAALPEPTRRAAFAAALRRVDREAARYPTWGDLHRLPVQHLLGNLPLLGRSFRVANLPVGGSHETPMKTEHNLTNRRHNATFGAQSRHLSDLGDPDANHFVLLGGQDGWLGSAAFADQVTLWREGQYVQVPLRPESVRRTFAHQSFLAPR